MALSAMAEVAKEMIYCRSDEGCPGWMESDANLCGLIQGIHLLGFHVSVDLENVRKAVEK
ncbi:MAG TPA: hypothetical protein DDW45_04990 [Gammaproteobacteria bacterium]|nr:hypothetical protein [Gammaproteobacteria bacterium]